jgi:hypothetical protein
MRQHQTNHFTIFEDRLLANFAVQQLAPVRLMPIVHQYKFDYQKFSYGYTYHGNVSSSGCLQTLS